MSSDKFGIELLITWRDGVISAAVGKSSSKDCLWLLPGRKLQTSSRLLLTDSFLRPQQSDRRTKSSSDIKQNYDDHYMERPREKKFFSNDGKMTFFHEARLVWSLLLFTVFKDSPVYSSVIGLLFSFPCAVGADLFLLELWTTVGRK